ncbi:MAG: hypothetical protein C0617_11415 [Desulfuromonas sp.]|mgnify:CR=1 FL=1|uniref:FAD:protein FMN transferase n=1 Tax=Desulfuromonas sp. TaxID=892 RepID=UPI000CA97BFB|nr:FAD:protein FMN transferase [Desulfuromonas sp.]PLX83527.1 MAG: hypothetical protein C0617_11415 [Desulfuromonas sp.]
MPFTRPLLILLLLSLVAFFALQRTPKTISETVSRSRILMGTVVEITALGADPGGLDEAVEAAFEEMARIERLMSSHLSGSEVARLSAAPEGLEVSAETSEVLELALTVFEESGGAFDPALGRLKALWSIESDHPRVPSREQVRTALATAGPGALQMEGRRVDKKSSETSVDLGGVAKGYAIDRAVDVLRRAGISSASVNAGGDLRLLGDKGGRPWKIGLQHPRRQGELLATLDLEGVAVVTSGDYERYFERDGIRYHHLFDPHSGYPASLCRSVTVVAPRADLADALATAAFVLGPERGLSLLEGRPGVEGLVVAADGSRSATSGLEGRLSWR